MVEWGLRLSGWKTARRECFKTGRYLPRGCWALLQNKTLIEERLCQVMRGMIKKGRLDNDVFVQEESDDINIIEFCVGEQYYGVSIMQVCEIIRIAKGIVPVSDAHPSVAGVVNLRGKIVPVINLAKHFCAEINDADKACRIIVSEKNHTRVGYLVNHVTRIHRILLSDVEPPSDLIQSRGAYIFGMTRLNDKVIFLLDLEKVTYDINLGHQDEKPGGGLSEVSRVDFDRTKKKILIAEDSPFMCNLIVQYLKRAGYNVVTVNNGFEAWQILEGTTRLPGFTNIGQYYHLLITDIEMPQMDGLHLIKSIRGHKHLKNFPCVVFSSLITDAMAEKCVEVGANNQVGKPQINQLIQIIDDLVIK
jgi:two-component system chemotaxis response regulator CheV